MSLDFDAFDTNVSRVRLWAVELSVVAFVGPSLECPDFQGWFGGGGAFTAILKCSYF